MIFILWVVIKSLIFLKSLNTAWASWSLTIRFYASFYLRRNINSSCCCHRPPLTQTTLIKSLPLIKGISPQSSIFWFCIGFLPFLTLISLWICYCSISQEFIDIIVETMAVISLRKFWFSFTVITDKVKRFILGLVLVLPCFIIFES